MTSDDSVGYKRPPKASRFRKGRSGNPRGRPKGRSSALPYDSVLGRMVTVRDGGVERRITAAEAFLIHLSRRGLEGDAGATRVSLDAIEAARARRCQQGHQAITIVVRFISAASSPNFAMQALRMAHKRDRYRHTARILLEPWLVEAALARLGSHCLTMEQQRIVREATRTPHKVRWPEWWTEKG